MPQSEAIIYDECIHPLCGKMKGKLIWLKADEESWEDVKPVVIKALEAGAHCILARPEHVKSIRELGGITIASQEPDGDIILYPLDTTPDTPLPDVAQLIGEIDALRGSGKEVAALVVIRNKACEELAARIGKHCDYLVVIGTDWKVIPLENLIASLQGYDVQLIAGVKDSEEARLALETMEHGADGVLLSTSDPNEVVRTVRVARSAGTGRVELVPARITSIRQVGMGDRVCVDTCALMSVGEGMLVGSQANGFFLVHSETEESPYVAARPFRVNAGAVHAYIKVGEKTRYLSELQGGDEVMVVDAQGNTRLEVVGRVKIERRPLVLIEAEVEDKRIKILLQNAETIKLVSKEGVPLSITSLKEGDEVLVHTEDIGRHFGMRIEESIIEK